jgi:hypothetical protein
MKNYFTTSGGARKDRGASLERLAEVAAAARAAAPAEAAAKAAKAEYYEGLPETLDGFRLDRIQRAYVDDIGNPIHYPRMGESHDDIKQRLKESLCFDEY